MLKKAYLLDPKREEECTVRIWIIVASAFFMVFLLVAAILRSMLIDTAISYGRAETVLVTGPITYMHLNDIPGYMHLNPFMALGEYSDTDRNNGSGF